MNAPRFRLLLWLSACLTTAALLGACKDASPPTAAPATPAASAAAPAPVAAAATAKPASYHVARYDPIHFKPAIDKATNEQCLACHAEVLKPSVRKTSPAGLSSGTAKAWYQQTSTYQGEQDTFHRRHMSTDFARQVMTMRCTTCHEGNDPREEAPGSSATDFGQQTLRKMVNPETVCLKCHGKMNHAVMGLPGPWEQSKAMFQNNCLLCHSNIRTSRHNVNYLNAKAIEELAAKPDGGDTCYGCHGGRAWYRTHYPYPRHAWPGMDPTVPDWAKGRPTESEVRFIAAAVTSGEKK